MSVFSSIVYDLTQYVKRFTSTTAPSTTPDRAGSLHFDTSAKKMYASYGTSSSADWVEVGTGETGATNAANCRLTLESGVPDSLNENDMKDILYLTKYKGNNLDLYDGTDWNRTEIDEISITNAGLAKNTIYDVFASNAAPIPSLEWNFTTDEGNFVTDSSGNGNHGTTVQEGLVKAPAWNASGKWGGCMYYDNLTQGAPQKVYKTGATGLPQGSSPVSICAFFKVANFINVAHIVGYGNYSGSVASSLFILVSSTLIYIHTGVTVYKASWSGDNNWHHVALVLEEGKTKVSEIKLYLDGVLKATSLHSGTDQDLAINGTKFVAGFPVWPTDWSNYAFNGYIDCVKVYSVGLSAPQVQEIYETNTLADANSVSLSLTAWNAPTSNAITSITAASPRVASCSVTPVTGSIITISGDAGEPSNNATWRVGTVVLNTSFELLYMDGTDSSTPANAGTASTYTYFDENQTRATALTTQDGVLVKTGDLTQRYIGTVRTWDTGQFMDSTYSRLVYNEYNQLEKKCGTRESSSVTAPEGTMVVGGFDFCPCFLNGTFANPVTVMASGKATTDAGVDLDVRPAINSHCDAGNTFSHFVLPESTTNWFSLSANFTSTVGYNFFNLVASSTNGETTFEKNSIDTVVKC